jgi:hypothetical protein
MTIAILRKCTQKKIEIPLLFSAKDLSDDTLVIPQGGASFFAEEGVSVLGKEISDFLSETNVKIETPVSIFLPSGNFSEEKNSAKLPSKDFRNFE